MAENFEDKAPINTSIADLGEFGFIKHLTEGIINQNISTMNGVGDDASIIQYDEGMQTLLSNELFTEGIDFNLAFSPIKHLGYKTVVATISDIYAMGGTPQQIMVSLGISNRFSVEHIEELYEGIKLACKLYSVDLVGGDTAATGSGLIIGITTAGCVPKGKAILRNGAKEGDLLVVTGDIGSAFLGLKILERENEVFQVNSQSQPDLEQYSYLIERQLKPEARKDIPILLKKLNVIPTSMIDLSDGLASETIHICQSSHVGVKLYEEKLPLDPVMIRTCEELNIDSTTIALNGGEDYELLFTINPNDFEKIKGNPNFTVIGHMTAASEGMSLVGRGGNQVTLTAQGWDNYLNK